MPRSCTEAAAAAGDCQPEAQPMNQYPWDPEFARQLGAFVKNNKGTTVNVECLNKFGKVVSAEVYLTGIVICEDGFLYGFVDLSEKQHSEYTGHIDQIVSLSRGADSVRRDPPGAPAV